MAADDGGQRLKGTLAARNPRTDELATFPPGTPREDLPSWVQVDDGAFDGEPAPAPARRRRRAPAATAPEEPTEDAGGDGDQDGPDGDDDGQVVASDGTDAPDADQDPEDGQEPPTEPPAADDAPPAKATRKKR